MALKIVLTGNSVWIFDGFPIHKSMLLFCLCCASIY